MGAGITRAGENNVLEVFDATPLLRINNHDIDQRRWSWDQQQVLAALQGMVNRQGPRLYVYSVGNNGGIDRFWLEKLRNPGQWLAEKQLVQRDNLPRLIAEYRRMIQGVVVWDERVPATALAASTAAGVEDLLPVRFDARPDSLYSLLTCKADGPRLPVKLRLLNPDGSSMFTGQRTGSAKCDATLWSMEHFLKTGECSPAHLAFYSDAYWISHPGNVGAEQTLLFNHDYFIAQRAFFFDLSPWDDEAPNDDPDQRPGEDARTLRAVMRAAYENARGEPFCIGGFIPWTQKYTDYTHGRHEGVATEWRYADIISCFNGYMDGDAPAAAPMANASVFSHFPLAAKYPQRHVSENDLRDMGLLDAQGKPKRGNYATIYVGDYDSAAWMYQSMPRIWEDPNRGRVPLGWAFDPSLEQRFPVGLAYARATATKNDSFISGDSGYGYLNPSDLVPPRKWSGLDSGLAGWEALCTQGFRRWDLGITGFVITGDAPAMQKQVKEAYTRFSPHGVVSQELPRLSHVQDVPFLMMASDLDHPDEGANQISDYFPAQPAIKPRFGVFRTILWTPTQHMRMFDLLSHQRPDIRMVSPDVLMALARRAG